ncbi:MAG: hypothetical protein AB7F22_10405 [Reyranella sp.]|uniref:hypothetical protein n=1 Tax=Reyranella sp. TaxID=1929291 RepID=UPI003D0AB903
MRAAAVFAVAALTAACASDPKAIQPTYVSANKYASASCEQINAELAIVVPRLTEQTADQRDQRRADIVLGVLVGLTPTMMGGAKGREADIAVLKGEHQALTSAAAEKGCPPPVLPPPAPKKPTPLPVTSSD